MTDPADLLFDGRVFAAVLFDLDGTLIDSTAAVVRSWSRWARERGLRPEQLVVAHGVPARQLLAAMLPAADVEAELARIEGLEVADVDGIRVLPGAARALGSLPAGRSAIVTSGTALLAAARIAAAGLAAPAVVVTADDVLVGKPDPQPYLLAAQRLGFAPADCLVVEDAPAGLASARAAGCATLALTTTHRPDQLVADVVLATLDQVRWAAAAGGVLVRADGLAVA